MRVFQAPPVARRRLYRGALVLCFGLHLGAGGLALAMTGKLSGFLLTFTPQAQAAVLVLATGLSPLDLRVSRERVFLANLGVGPQEALAAAFLAVGAVEAVILGLVTLSSALA